MDKAAQNELKTIKDFYGASLILWIIFAGFSIALIERAQLLEKILLGLIWGYPVLIVIMYSISEKFYEKSNYMKGRITVFSPLWLPILIIFLDTLSKAVSKL